MPNNILNVTNLTKSFHQANQKISVLKGLNFQLKDNESAAIVGRSGSGKSTLLSLLSGLDRSDEGDILFFEKKFSQMSEADITLFRGQHMGIIFQQFHLLPHLSALENVSLALEIMNQNQDASERAFEALRQVGLDQRADHLPSKLSGGEKQRVAIARAMVIEPKLLLADEPSGSLDEATGAEVMDLVFDLVKRNKSSLVLVTHSEDLARQCDKIYRLDQGSLKEEKKSEF